MVNKKKLETVQEQKAFMSAFDWKRMTEQDEEVWHEILQMLNT